MIINGSAGPYPNQDATQEMPERAPRSGTGTPRDDRQPDEQPQKWGMATLWRKTIAMKNSQEFDINRFKYRKIEWVPHFGYRLTSGDGRWFETYDEAYNAARN